jgi:hypothetical protein
MEKTIDRKIDFNILPKDLDGDIPIEQTAIFKEWTSALGNVCGSLYKKSTSPNKLSPDLAEKKLAQIIQEEIGKVELKSDSLELTNGVRHWEKNTDLYSTLNFIHENNLIITDNGSVYVDHDRLESMYYNFQSGLMSDRDVIKAKEKKAEMDGDPILTKFYKTGQLGVKVAGNGAYGAMGKVGSVHYCKDIVGSITGQGRAVVSTAIVTVERLFGDNFGFKNLSQGTEFIHKCLMYDTKKVQGWRPQVSPERVINRMVEKTYAKDFEERAEIREYYTSLIDNLSYDDRIAIYYRCNLIDFIIDNPIARQCLHNITHTNKPFLASNNIPPEFKQSVDLFVDLCMNYVYLDQLDYSKKDRAINGPRKITIYYDTDSCYTGFRYYIDLCKALRIIDVHENKDEIFRLLSTLARLLDVAFAAILKLFADNYNTTSLGAKFIKIKNEFLFEKIILTKGKKRYLCSIRIREGNFFEKAKLELKGVDLVKSTANQNTRAYLEKMIVKYVLKDKVMYHEIIEDIYKLEVGVANSIEAGETTYFSPSKIKHESVYSNPSGNPGVTGAWIWNALYPTREITDGGIYRVGLNLSDEALALIPADKAEILRNIRDNGIPGKPGFEPEMDKKTGKMKKFTKAKWFSIPYGTESIPKEIIPIIDAEKIILEQARSVQDVMKTIGLGTITIKSGDKKVGSGLLSL